MIKFVAPCLFGIEASLCFEAKKLGFKNVQSENGRVFFEGELIDIPRANISLRFAERVCICLAQFKAKSFEELFQGVKKINWQEWISKTDEFPVKGSSLNSTLHSVPDCQSIIKKAVVEKLKSVYGVNWLEETGDRHQIRFTILKDNVTIMLDTSGQGLHKRGYRQISAEAPIKETIAAALIDVARYKPDRVFYDPMCGSGTFLIEAALMAKGIAPGLSRRFSGQFWSQIPKRLWKEALDEAKSSIINTDAQIVGYDIDEKSISIARANAEKAGVGDIVKVYKQDISAFSPKEERITVVTNPPYGERLLDINSARELYKTMGKVFTKNQGKGYFIIAPDEEFETYFGRESDKKRKIYNGMIKCNFYQYFRG